MHTKSGCNGNGPHHGMGAARGGGDARDADGAGVARQYGARLHRLRCRAQCRDGGQPAAMTMQNAGTSAQS